MKEKGNYALHKKNHENTIVMIYIQQPNKFLVDI